MIEKLSGISTFLKALDTQIGAQSHPTFLFRNLQAWMSVPPALGKSTMCLLTLVIKQQSL